MLIEQIIVFEWKGPGPPGRSCTPITVYFYDKTKISEENLQGDYLFNLGFKPSPFTKILVKCQNQASASDLPLYDIFVPQKVPLLKISDDVVACDLWFGPPQSKILAAPMGFTSQIEVPYHCAS